MTSVRRWLALVCGSIALLVLLGGITRLTESGLSIVDWDPILGALPPLDAEDWRRAFDRYKESPQYRQVNFEMSLPAFKRIFLWEYLHRLMGRVLGLVVALPLLLFTIRGQVRGALAIRLWFGFVLGALQGTLGWFMVKSGLVDEPRVSHFRLAAHLLLALVVLAYHYWICLDLKRPAMEAQGERGQDVLPRSLWRGFGLLGVLIALQITYGAFVAGLRAGIGYNTFPGMGGRLFPPDFLALSPPLSNFLLNRSSVQWVHRTLGLLVLAGALTWIWRFSKRAKNTPGLVPAVRTLGVLVLAQYGLGVLTLVLRVPVPLASLHQLGAILIALTWVRIRHEKIGGRTRARIVL